jgi:transposase
MSTYSQEFKDSAIKLATDSDQPYSQTAKELGIKPNTLYNWLSTKRLTPTSEQDMETINLRKELKRTKQELEILKKAAAYFASQLKVRIY